MFRVENSPLFIATRLTGEWLAFVTFHPEIKRAHTRPIANIVVNLAYALTQTFDVGIFGTNSLVLGQIQDQGGQNFVENAKIAKMLWGYLLNWKFSY